MFFLSLIILLSLLSITLVVAQGIKRIPHLRGVSPGTGAEKMPSVSVIIPACNEEKSIEPALTSIINLDYPGLEIIVVNDRSTDRTGRILERMGKVYPQLRVETISELPAGWLGKNHALQYGAERAAGDYLLFTDADVVMEKSTLARAMQQVRTENIDHLALIFEIKVPGGLLNAMVLEVGAGLLFIYRPWKAGDPESSYHMGVGAFNLVRREAYEKAGRHEEIKMWPIDDIELGRLIKEKGFSQQCMNGQGFVSVRWYDSVSEMAGGLMKNVFALYDYSLPRAAASVFLQIMLGVFPLWAVFWTSGATRLLFGAAVLVRFLSFAKAFSDNNIRPWYALWSLVSPSVSIFITMRATLVPLARGGISWRGTFYPLGALRQQKRRLRDGNRS